jgi:prepilin-type N-terminal cleavage/methylation domain-containing protein
LNNFNKNIANTKKLKMKNKNSRKAFSLVEISIVILIIGLLIAGISKAGDMIFDVGLKSASSATKGAKVGRMAGLALWLETTTNESILEKERYEGTTVSVWRDINPQSSSKFIFINSSAAKYAEKGHNNLPAIRALDSANFFTVNTSETSGTVASFSSNQIFSSGAFATIFVVLKPKAITGVTTNLISFCPSAGCAGGNEISVSLNATGNVLFTAMSGAAASVSVASTSAYTAKSLIIVSALKDTVNQKIFVNGTDLASASPTNTFASTNSFSGTFKVGGASANDANSRGGIEIYEVIVFSSPLNSTDRQTVETYLGKKYSVPMIKTSNPT